jgi:hypothetical protein
MLVAEPAPSHSSQHYLCLDMVSATFEAPQLVKTDTAILLEVWEAGGLLHIDCEAQAGSSLRLTSSNGDLHGKVRSCVNDEYGYLVEFAVDSGDGWFPGAYRPPYLLPAPKPGG